MGGLLVPDPAGGRNDRESHCDHDTQNTALGHRSTPGRRRNRNEKETGIRPPLRVDVFRRMARQWESPQAEIRILYIIWRLPRETKFGGKTSQGRRPSAWDYTLLLGARKVWEGQGL